MCVRDMSEWRCPSHPLVWLLGVAFVGWVSVCLDEQRPKSPLGWAKYLACFGAVCWAVVVLASLGEAAAP